jgi:hypothetical protein
MNEPLQQEVQRLEAEVKQDTDRLKAKKRALRKLRSALEQLSLPL